MVAAGMYRQDAADTFLDSLRPGSVKVPDLVYAALGCGTRRAEAALHGLDGVVVSHDNCPHQSVVCGAPAEVATVLERLKAEGVLGQELPFRSGFHTPMWEPYLGQVRAAFARLPLQRGTLPLWSATTCAPFPPEPEAVRELVVRHLLEPVRFRELTLRLYEDAGVRGFVTLGPGSLPGFIEDTLRDRPHYSVAASSPGSPASPPCGAPAPPCGPRGTPRAGTDWPRTERVDRPGPPTDVLHLSAHRQCRPPGAECCWTSARRWSASARPHAPPCPASCRRPPPRSPPPPRPPPPRPPRCPRNPARSSSLPWTQPPPKDRPRRKPRRRPGPGRRPTPCASPSPRCPTSGTTASTSSPTHGRRTPTGSPWSP